jgi:hypothetical protein
MNELFLDALIDSAKMIPFLLIIYFLVELFERKFGGRIEHTLEKTAKAGPLLGALFGCVPQCGFSVVAASLYTRRIITAGTLLAVFLSTSDEAIPVLLSAPDQAKTVGLLIGIKLVIALVAGLLIDRLIRRREPAAVEPAPESHVHGCCHHHVAEPSGYRQLLLHPLIHTAKIFVFIFLVTLGLNSLIAGVGEENLGNVLLRESLFQPFLASLIGLIPNCAASVAIAGAFLKGGLSFGSTISGLCCSGGLGLLVLLRENHDLKDTLRIIGLLVLISTLIGSAIQLLYG